MRRLALVLIGTVAVLAACGPPPPEGPRWAATVEPWTAGASPAEVAFTATTEDWWAVVESSPDGTTATLHLHPRSGARGAPSASPTVSFSLPNGAADLAMSDHVVAVRSRAAVAGSVGIELFERDGATWSAAATVTRPVAADREAALDVSDTRVVVGERAMSNHLTLPGRVAVVPISLAGAGISWSPATVQILDPGATWPDHARNGFGAEVSIVGEVLAAGTDWDRVAVYGASGPSLALDQVLTSPVDLGSSGRFGRSLSLDTAGSARLAVGSGGGFTFSVPQPGRVDVFERTSSGWTIEQSIAPRAGSALSGFALGSEVALSGTRLATSAHWVQVARPGGSGFVDDLRIEIHELAASPTFSDELSVYDTLGGTADHPTATFVGALSLELAGSHLAAGAYVGFGSDPAHFAAVSYDRR